MTSPRQWLKRLGTIGSRRRLLDGGVMSGRTRTTKHFFLTACDPELLCPILSARFEVSDIDLLKGLLGHAADDDPNLEGNYTLEDDDLQEIVTTFGISFDPSQLAREGLAISLYQESPGWLPPPYLVHTGWELPLLLNGDKKLACFSEPYPPMSFEGEDRFDYWVAQGKLYKSEILEPFSHPPKSRNWLGVRRVYYTVIGEEWRIPAIQLLWESGRWNETLERLEGLLFGYEPWQMDWWIEHGRRHGGFGGLPLCCAVTAAGLDWLKSAGFRALPPCDKPALAIIGYDPSEAAAMREFMMEEADSVALVCFAVPFWSPDELPPVSWAPTRWLLPSERIPELNHRLHNHVAVALTLNGPL